MKYYNILGTNINVIDMQKTVDYLEENIENLRGKYICVSNVHTTVMAFRDKEYQKVQNQAAMALPDGKPLSIVSRRRGFKDAKRVPGPDLMLQIFAESKERQYRHYFYGSTNETLTNLEAEIKKKYPYLIIAGMYAPPFRPLTEEEDKQIIVKINEAEPDFIWVGLGAPKQEIWMHLHEEKVNGLMIGVGAAFNFTAGTVKRAPQWMQEMCLEWLYRILQDPVRLLPRYIGTNISFLWNVSKESKKIRKVKKNKNKDRLKIAMIGHKRIPSREGGVEIVVNELAIRMVQSGNVVEVYNRRGSHVSGKKFIENIGDSYKGIRIISIPTFENGKLNAIVYSFLASIRVLFGKYDIIHYHAEGPCTMLWIPKLFRKRIVVTIHGLDWQRSKWGNFASRVLKFGEKTAVRYANEIIVLSKNMKDYFQKYYGRRTIFIPNGIVRPEYRKSEEITKKWGLEKDGYFLFLARIVPEKGAHYLLEAFKMLETDKKLVIAGGSSHSKEYFEEIKYLAEDDKRILFTDFVGGTVLEELYSNAYAFILPSDVEGMAIGLLEAMGYGNCCVVSDIPENMEVVEDKAIKFMHGNVLDLNKCLQQLLDNPEKVFEYKEKAAEFICNKYDWDSIVQKTLQLYRDILG